MESDEALSRVFFLFIRENDGSHRGDVLDPHGLVLEQFVLYTLCSCRTEANKFSEPGLFSFSRHQTITRIV